MLCDRCRNLPAEAIRPRNEPPPARVERGAEATLRLADLFCENCEATLPLPDPSSSVLERLAQLARFGFGEGQAILARGPHRSEGTEAG